MQTTKKLFPLLIAGSLVLSLACTKNIDLTTYTVEYRIENADEFLRSIKYMDASKNLVMLDAADFPGGFKTITVTKPFVAELEVYAENRSIQSRIYRLVVLVDGVPVANETLYVPIFDEGSAKVKFEL